MFSRFTFQRVTVEFPFDSDKMVLTRNVEGSTPVTLPRQMVPTHLDTPSKIEDWLISLIEENEKP